MARVCNLSPVNLLSFRKCLLLSLDSWAQVGLSSCCSPLLSMSWDNRNKLVQLIWRHQVLQVCSVGFIQNHLWCSIVQKIPWCQFTLKVTEISTRFLEIFLGRTRPLLACYIFEKINFYKPTWYNHHKNEILSNICLSISHIQPQPLTMETSGPCISLAMTIVTWTRAVIAIKCMMLMFHVTIVWISHQSQC